MRRTRRGMLGTLVLGATLTLLLTTQPADARRNELSVINQFGYTIIRKYGIEEWQLTTPKSALELAVRVQSSAPTEVLIHGQTYTVPSGARMRFPTNKALGKLPRATPFTLRIPRERGRTKGIVYYLK